MSSPEDSNTRSASTGSGKTQSGGGKGGRKSSSLPSETVEYLKAWMMSPEHIAHPYPTDQEKAQIMAETGIELKQLTNWFVNNRKRFWKPRVEAQLQQNNSQANSLTSRRSPNDAPSATAHGIAVMSTPAGAPTQQAQPQAAFPVLPQSGCGQRAPPSSHLQSHGNAAQHALNDDPHTISEGSGSSACISDDESVSTNSFTAGHPTPATLANLQGKIGGATVRREEVDVHVLRPENSSDEIPTIRDLTIKGTFQKDRILATFPKCQISYTVPIEIEHDRKKVQSRRDGEVLRVKKHYLKLYLATRGIHTTPTPTREAAEDLALFSSVSASTDKTPGPTQSNTHLSLPVIGKRASPSGPLPTPHPPSQAPNALPGVNEASNQPPKKRRRKYVNGEDEWRAACLNAKSLFCESLPGLEEAAVMFGYASQ